MKNMSVKLIIMMNDLSGWILFAMMRQCFGFLRGYLELVAAEWLELGWYLAIWATQRGMNGTSYLKVIHQERHMQPFNLVADLPFPRPQTPESSMGAHKHNRAVDMMCGLLCCTNTQSHILLKQKVTERHPAMNGMRPSHLALTLPLGQCHNNCHWQRGFHGNQRVFQPVGVHVLQQPDPQWFIPHSFCTTLNH